MSTKNDSENIAVIAREMGELVQFHLRMMYWWNTELTVMFPWIFKLHRHNDPAFLMDTVGNDEIWVIIGTFGTVQLATWKADWAELAAGTLEIHQSDAIGALDLPVGWNETANPPTLPEYVEGMSMKLYLIEVAKVYDKELKELATK